MYGMLQMLTPYLLTYLLLHSMQGSGDVGTFFSLRCMLSSWWIVTNEIA